MNEETAKTLLRLHGIVESNERLYHAATRSFCSSINGRWLPIINFPEVEDTTTTYSHSVVAYWIMFGCNLPG